MASTHLHAPTHGSRPLSDMDWKSQRATQMPLVSSGGEFGPDTHLVVFTRDEAEAREISQFLAPENVHCECFADASKVIRTLKARPVSAVLFNGTQMSSLARSVLTWRECNGAANIPHIAYAQKPNRTEILQWFADGADDVLVGHLNLNELAARTLNAIRKKKSATDHHAAVLQVGGFRLDRTCNSVTVNGELIYLTEREFSLAWLFFSSRGSFITRQQIALSVWGSDVDLVDRSIEQYVYRLRKKLNLGPTSGVLLKTVYSQGYRLEVQQSERRECTRATDFQRSDLRDSLAQIRNLNLDDDPDSLSLSADISVSTQGELQLEPHLA